jgi:hypothetical protein
LRFRAIFPNVILHGNTGSFSLKTPMVTSKYHARVCFLRQGRDRQASLTAALRCVASRCVRTPALIRRQCLSTGANNANP